MTVIANIQEPIAVVGLACRLPGNSNSPKALWDFLTAGGCAENEPPTSRFNFKGHSDGSMKPGTMRSPGGMFLENIDLKDIDARFFALSTVDAISMDPQQRQLLEVVYEGLENAGISLEDLKSKLYGCFVGSYASDYSDVQARDPEDRTPSCTVGSGRAMLSNRISHFLDIKGPSMTIDTACSGSLIAIDLACRYLQTGDADGAIVAGCNLYISPEHNMDLSAIRASASPTGRCHTFDAKADGYIKAEAVNMVVLKRLDDALRDRDPIRAIIRGSSTNSDGWTPGIASPSSEAQARAIRSAYARAGISDYNCTSFLECHGTGTQAGDPIEVGAVSSVFSAGRDSSKPLIIGSVKSNIGHSEPAAGISGFLKATLALESGIIPGNPTYETPNPSIDFDALKVRVSRSTIPWPEVPFRRASVNSFGYGGSNAHVILDEATGFISNYEVSHVSSYKLDFDDDFFTEQKSEHTKILVFSANDEASLSSYSKAILKHLVNPNVSVSLNDLAYTLSERRTHHFCRSYVVTDSTSFTEQAFKFGKRRSKAPNIGFVFTGQGAQWPQMGKSVVETFPVARLLLTRLQNALQTLPDPPKWSLLDELVESRTPEHLRLPEFSQPLVTALQLMLLAVLNFWKVSPQSVVGHSSGEIAAAVSAGHLTPEEAIKVAYFRGKAATELQDELGTSQGMLAVGLSPSDVQRYLKSVSDNVKIACFNSPESITLSGKTLDLEVLMARIQADGHFARLLHVNLAYHSHFIDRIANRYGNLVNEHCKVSTCGSQNTLMYSSVTGYRLKQKCDLDYWKSNMVSPVRFQQAFEEMIEESDIDFLVEVGPSGALAAPIMQIRKSLAGQLQSFEYCAALSRGPEAVTALYDVAGRLFLSGGSVDISRVNQTEDCPNKPLTIVDLPNYQWNHSTKYWHESDASRDWRFRSFPQHDLLGSKVMGTSWHAPSWKKLLRVADVPWLKDHELDNDIVFPAAAYIAMAVEAFYQMAWSLDLISKACAVHEVSYRLRNVSFLRAIILEEGADNKLFLSLTPPSTPNDAWHEFKISSQKGEAWTEHCRGFICLHQGHGETAPKDVLRPLKHSVPALAWYKALANVGFNFGPSFQKKIEVESVAGRRSSRALLSFAEPKSTYKQSSYPIHPACIDGCFQSGVSSLWQGFRSSINKALVPAIIDDLVIRSRSSQPQTGVAVTSSEYRGIGRLDDAKSFKTNASIYDTNTGSLLFEMRGLHYNELDTPKDRYGSHRHTRLSWKEDVSFLSPEQFRLLLPSQEEGISNSGSESTMSCVDRVADLVAHKTSNLALMEINMTSSPRSLWLEPWGIDLASRGACSRHLFTCNSSSCLVEAQEKYQHNPTTEFDVFDIINSHGNPALQGNFDFVIIHMHHVHEHDLHQALRNAHPMLRQGGYLLLVQTENTPPSSEDDALGSVPFEKTRLEECARCKSSVPQGFKELWKSSQSEELDTNVLASLYTPQAQDDVQYASSPSISLLNLAESPVSSEMIRHSLTEIGWHVTIHPFNTSDLPAESIILVLEDTDSHSIQDFTGDQWNALQNILNSGNKILWVTTGSQFAVSNPQSALINGLARSARAEDPSLILKLLDLESGTLSTSSTVINKVLLSLQGSLAASGVDNEYCERRGIIYVSRVLVDDLVNKVASDTSSGAELQTETLHNNSACIRMQCERPGALDSLHFSKVSTKADAPADGFVEVDIHAAGVNYKDVATVLGIVPENQYLLGLEGAGVIRQVGRSAGPYKVGDRVLVDSRGCFANRVQAPIEGLYHLPDNMSFEEAATLCIVFLTSIHALLDLASLKKGQSVLIHSAAGGVGIAAIQICRYVGAEIFVTAGNEEKRQFLVNTYDIPASHVFSSRNADFAPQLMKATNGKGVDVILNFLTGNLLDESWRCIADRGIMLEIGKRDIIDRGHLSMEPFARNASYRALDMSHSSITPTIVAGLISRMFALIAEGAIKPISPVKVFSFNEIPDALRYMRAGTHIGKVVISDGLERDTKVPTRSSPLKLELRSDASYLIVGGLKGLCGSLAVYLAQHGAKELVILSRSGYEDEKSQAVLADLDALGTQVELVKGDVSSFDDVLALFQKPKNPIRGIIQGAMVLRDKIFSSMTLEDFQQALQPKVQGTWNLHHASLKSKTPLDFFTMLSSISGIIGQKGQANYAAANAFLDAFAAYRHRLGLAANSVDLGIIEDVGYLSQRQSLSDRMKTQSLVQINEGLLQRILALSIIQQTDGINPASAAQTITGISVPLPPDSELLADARFGGLCFSRDAAHTVDDAGQDGSNSKAVQAFLAMIRAKVDRKALLAEAVQLVNRQFTKSLGLAEPMEPEKSLSVYGMDSLAAVELRNWVKAHLGSDVTTLEILNATSLLTLCERIIAKLAGGGEAPMGSAREEEGDGRSVVTG